MPKFLTALTGLSTCRPSVLVFALLCCLLCRTADAQTTNVDFFVVGSRYQMNSEEYVYDTIPTGCILFWSILPDGGQRAMIYRSESGHIAFYQEIQGVDYFILADSKGMPMPWYVNSGWRRQYNVVVEGGATVTTSAVYPSSISKEAYDVIRLSTLPTGVGCSLFYLPTRPVVGSYDLLARSGKVGFRQIGYDYNSSRVFTAPVGGLALDNSWVAGAWQHVTRPFEGSERMELRFAFRASNFMITLEAFKGHLASKWWLRNKYTVGSSGITGININGGTGMGGYDDSVGSGPAAPSEGGAGLGGSVPGDITNPPVTPMGLNGKWVYDPEKKIWQWHGDYADNSGQINPFDNSVMPENQERGGAQEATLRQVKDGIDGLAKEDTLQQIRISFEEFQKQQRITPSELQAMIDNAVVSVVDGQIQYWEGKNLAPKLDGIKTSVEQGSDQVSSKVDDVKEVAERIDTNGKNVIAALGPQGRVNFMLNTVNSSITTIGDSIVNAIGDINIPENPTTDEQDKEPVDISEPALSQFVGWLTFDYPQIHIPPLPALADYDIGVMGWKIPFSYFSQSNGNIWAVVFLRVRTILAWLVYLSATLGVVKAMGAGV